MSTNANAILLQHSCVFWTAPIAALALVLGDRPAPLTPVGGGTLLGGVAIKHAPWASERLAKSQTSDVELRGK